MLAQLISAGGVTWAWALAFEFAAVIAESAASGKGDDGEKLKRHVLMSGFLGVAALLTPGLLLAHAYIEWAKTHPNIEEARNVLVVFATTIGCIGVVAAVVAGSVIGWVLGALTKPAKPFLHIATLPFAAIAFGLALIAAWPDLPLLIGSVMRALS